MSQGKERNCAPFYLSSRTEGEKKVCFCLHLSQQSRLNLLLSSLSKYVSKVIRNFRASEVSRINRRGFNFDVAPSLVRIWCPLISMFRDIWRCMRK